MFAEQPSVFRKPKMYPLNYLLNTITKDNFSVDTTKSKTLKTYSAILNI